MNSLAPQIILSNHSFLFQDLTKEKLLPSFGKAEQQHPWYGWILLRDAHRSPPHLSVRCQCLLQSVFHHQGHQVCSWCSSHILKHHMPLILLILNLKMVSDQKYPKVHTIQTTCSCFYCLHERSFFIIIQAISRQCFVYGQKLDHWGFPIAAMIGDVIPSFTTNY
jgi:hypothetical protein